MICMACNAALEACSCPCLGDRMREVSGPGGHVASRWCAACDQHYAVCRCENPRWMVRSDGKLSPMPPEWRAQFPDLSQGAPT